MTDRRLFLLDAYALIYRAYYALMRSPRNSALGFNTAAIFGFCNSLDEILRKEKPDYIAVCFDPPGGKTFRHEEYPEYKAGRDKQPEDITLSVPWIKQLLEAYRIPAIEMERYEADDVIGTLARRAEAEGFTTFMMTPDKDYGQLVDEHTFMYRPPTGGKGFEIRGPKEVCERYGIESPRQVIDMLALEGDSADNIPGCPGVGEKTAAKLIAEWGSVENMIEHASEIKGATGRKIAENASQILFSKRLATICTDVPLEIGLEDLRRREPDVPALLELFGKLDFRTLASRLRNSDSQADTSSDSSRATDNSEADMGLFGIPADDAETPVQTAEAPGNFDTLWNVQVISEAVASACECAFAAVLPLCSGDEAMTARWHGVALAYGKRTVYVTLPQFESERREILDILVPLWNRPGTTVISDNVKRDCVLLQRHGISFKADYFDTSLAHYLIAPESRHDLPELAHSYLSYDTVDYSLTATERQKLYASPGEQAIKARCQSATAALALRTPLLDEIDSLQLRGLLDDIELPFAMVLASMELAGVRIDSNMLGAMSRKLTSRLGEIEASVFELAGHAFNIGSPAQVGEVLFGELNIDPKAKRTKRGAWSTTEEVLEKYSKSNPIVQLILDYRGVKKLLATYIDALPRLVNPATGKIHTTFNQTGTATGRISSNNPNLQNIPVRTDAGREIRRAFVPDEGHLMMAADYSQIELRLMAHISGDESMTEAFLSGEDIHRATAAKIFHEPLSEVTDAQRRAAKTANFGIIYGISAFGLSERLGIPRGEAKELIEGYLNTYPGVRRYMDEAVENARHNEAVTTLMGRRRLLPEINSRNAVVRGYAERNAINAPLQGSAADIIKKAMIAIARRLDAEGFRSKMILQVHDELVFDVVPEELDRLKAMVVDEMQGAFTGRVPLTVETGVADNWLDAH
ncbi:MAG: DNA polymerase I [Muribaculaceae bacterium]|nr:DNA polymerase I [Muribaculaceae bacterium]